MFDNDFNSNFQENGCYFNTYGINKYIDFENKEMLWAYHMANFSKKLRTMFKYSGLPDEITSRQLELRTQKGYSIFLKWNDKVYNVYGGLGGKPDFNYNPTIATVAIPALPELPKMWRIDWGYEFFTDQTKDLGVCVVLPNDCLLMGTSPTNSYYASQIVENDLTMNCNLINFRLMNLLVAADDDTKKALDGVIDNLKKGKLSSVLDNSYLLEKLKSLPFSNTQGNNIVQLLEQRQYIKGSWWNEWGVQSNYNMKRETITSSENILNVDSLLPIMDDMLEVRENAIKLINKNFGTNISVDFGSAWKKLKKELELKEKELEVQNSDKKTGDNKEVDNEDDGNENKD